MKKLLTIAIAATALFAFAPSAMAKTYTVTTGSDHAPDGCSHGTHLDCTLREAVLRANSHAGSDKIVLKGKKTYKLSRGAGSMAEDLAARGDLDITGKLTIASSSRHRATIDAQHKFRIFEVFSDLKLDNLTLKHGSADTEPGITGGAVQLQMGKLTVTHSKLVGNEATGGGAIDAENVGRISIYKSTLANNIAYYGGAIQATVPTNISQSTIRNNTSHNQGGGIWVSGNDSPLTVKASTFTGNRNVGPDTDGGALFVGGLALASLTNDTFDGNQATGSGGAIGTGLNSTVHLTASTIARNLADSDHDFIGDGGGIAGAYFYVRDSIIALNGSTNPSQDCAATGTSLGHNLIGVVSGSGAMFSTSVHDLYDTSSSQLKLGTLASNGGPTKTDALKKHSRAIGKADNHGPGRDQRGVKRDKHPDIGAFER